MLTQFESSRQTEDERRQHAPQIKVGEIPGENSFPRDLNVVLTRAQVSTEREGDSQQRPHAKEETPAQPPAMSVIETLSVVWIEFPAHEV